MTSPARKRTPPIRPGRAWGALLLGLLLVGGCDAPQAPPTDDATAKPQALRLGISNSIMSTPVLIAEAQDLLTAQGLALDLTYYNSGKQALAALLAGQIDVSTTADAPIMRAVLDGQDGVVILATFIYSHAHGKILARRSQGIETPTDLRGKRMGLEKNTTADLFQQVLLIESGVDLDTVEGIDLPTERLAAAIEAGEVDAIATWEPHISHAAQTLGDDAVIFTSKEGLRLTFNLVTRPSVVAQHRETLVRLLRAVEAGVEFANGQPRQAQRIISERLGIPVAVIERQWNDYVFKLFLDQGLLLTLEAEARWHLRDMGKPNQPLPDFLRYIDPGPLRQLIPGSVTLIR
ncbi:ABC transporter substrate-binding protein [Thiocystis violacea]|uniref:ABC transporter substrate-binding protein n=1 Tax=Thiocystis violacea TaxID=13725 RepID=UPI001904B1A5|nr:NrtA/SsuA/CpmA family ABC transporter substrate-binding protein [Thiocystis violacea]MBK1724631.1 hypothetical protein [Thiocystis violacea]